MTDNNAPTPESVETAFRKNLGILDQRTMLVDLDDLGGFVSRLSSADILRLRHIISGQEFDAPSARSADPDGMVTLKLLGCRPQQSLAGIKLLRDICGSLITAKRTVDNMHPNNPLTVRIRSDHYVHDKAEWEQCFVIAADPTRAEG